ncbi:MAG: hypothetical protein AAFY72_17940, partial [Cyanobacteria bacterium J06649_4]
MCSIPAGGPNRTCQQEAAQDMTGGEMVFWQASELAALRRERTRLWVTGGLALGFGLASLFTDVAFWNVRAANRNNIKVLAQSVATLNASGDNFEVVLMALRAVRALRDGLNPKDAALMLTSGSSWVRQIHASRGKQQAMLYIQKTIRSIYQQKPAKHRKNQQA